MMYGRLSSHLVVIENGHLNVYHLDDRRVWKIGRGSPNFHPDIRLYSLAVSRRHGRFENIDGVWFYLDEYGKNGTIHNNTHLQTGKNGRKMPIMPEHGDIFIFGAGNEAAINSKTVWAMYVVGEYVEQEYETGGWRHGESE